MRKLMFYSAIVYCLIAATACHKSAIVLVDYTGMYEGKTSQGELMTVTVKLLDDDFYVTEFTTTLNFLKLDGSIIQMPITQSDPAGIMPLNDNQFQLDVDYNDPTSGYVNGTINETSKKVMGNIYLHKSASIMGEEVYVNTDFILSKK